MARKNQPSTPTTSEPHLLHLTGLKYDTAQLLVLHGELQGEPVQFLIDSGASANFVNASLVEKFAWTTHTKAQSDAVQLANGLVEGSRCVLPDAALSIGTYEDLDTFHVTRLSGHDVILGKAWLDRLNPVVDWSRNKLMFSYADQQHVLIAPELVSRRKVRAVTTKQVNKAITGHDVETTMSFYAEVTSEIPKCEGTPEVEVAGYAGDVVDLESVLQQFADVFPDKLPPGLPPERAVEHSIELEPAQSPPCRGIYPLSETDLKELKSQLSELGEAGFIRPSVSP